MCEYDKSYTHHGAQTLEAVHAFSARHPLNPKHPHPASYRWEYSCFCSLLYVYRCRSNDSLFFTLASSFSEQKSSPACIAASCSTRILQQRHAPRTDAQCISGSKAPSLITCFQCRSAPLIAWCSNNLRRFDLRLDHLLQRRMTVRAKYPIATKYCGGDHV